jgi:hypothetical protein
MAQLMFRCPYTAEYPISVHCPHCGAQHHGIIADGCLTEERAAPPSPD